MGMMVELWRLLGNKKVITFGYYPCMDDYASTLVELVEWTLIIILKYAHKLVSRLNVYPQTIIKVNLCQPSRL